VAAPWSWYSISQFLDALLKRIDERIGLRGLCVLFGNDLCQICSPEPKGLVKIIAAVNDTRIDAPKLWGILPFN